MRTDLLPGRGGMVTGGRAEKKRYNNNMVKVILSIPFTILLFSFNYSELSLNIFRFESHCPSSLNTSTHTALQSYRIYISL